jgi:hypothetical protein
MKLLFLLFVLFLAVINAAYGKSLINKRQFGFFDDLSVADDDTVDWKSLKVKEIKLDTKDFNISEKDLFQNVKKCIEKCMKKVDSNIQIRDTCIASECDIY